MPPEEDAYPLDSNEGPEEGEILSDDQLEDILSDESNNMDWGSNGKSIRNNQHLHALCLSSVSDTSTTHREIVTTRHPRSRRKRPHYRGQEHRGHCKRRRTCRRRRDISNSSSDQEDTTLDIRLKEQLKAAVKLDLIENAHKNSLRTRLNAMVNGGESKSDTEIINDSIEIIANDSEHTVDAPENEDIIDDELIHLRLAALKTAISNKFAKRKKKKNEMNKENNSVEQAPQAQTNNDNNEIKETENNTPSTPPLEEDEDVLRALLLASMSKKITLNQPEPLAEPIINNKNLKINNFNNVNRAFNNGQRIIKVPQVKPLIIRVNSDSEDSDWDLSNQEKSLEKNLPKINHKIVAEPAVNNRPQENGVTSCSNELLQNGEIKPQKLSKINPKLDENLVKRPQEKVEKNTQKKFTSYSDNLVEENPEKPQDSATIVTKKNVNPNGIKDLENAKLQEAKALSIIESSVEKFLKEQRAKVESRQNLKNNTKKFPGNFKPPPKKIPLDIKTQAKKNPSNLKIHSKKNFVNKPKLTPNSPDLEKSAIKFLPANKMEEYQKLQNLLKQKKAQKLLLTNTKSNKSTQTLKDLVPEIPKIRLENEDIESGLLKREQEKRSCSSVLRTTLKQLEMKNSSGRFQIQDRYKDLRLLIRNINEVNKEQKQCEQNVDRLVKELAEARQKQEELHRRMLTSVTTLANEKKKIDLSSFKSVIVNKTSITSTRTSTPIKPSLPISTITLASTMPSGKKHVSDKSELKILNHTTTSKDQPKDGNENEVRDPNDIDEVIEQTAEKLAALEKVEQCDNEIEKIKRLDCNSPSESHQSSAIKPVKANNAPITSTPIKPSLPTATMTSLASTSTITSDQSLICDRSELPIFDQTTIQNDQVIDENKVRDPNDIDKIIQKTEEKLAGLKETNLEMPKSRYLSPLDHRQRQTDWNPLVIICPFEMNGTCKDSECTFNHFPK